MPASYVSIMFPIPAHLAYVCVAVADGNDDEDDKERMIAHESHG